MLMLSGTIRDRTRWTEAAYLHRNLVLPLKSAARVVAIILCAEPQAQGSPFVREIASWRLRTIERYYSAEGQLDRLRVCFAALRDRTYDVYVRARPDLIFFGRIILPPRGTIALRVRMMTTPDGHPPRAVHGAQTSTATRQGGCRLSLAPPARYQWETRAALGCSLLDDQFAVVPSTLASDYFLGRCSSSRHATAPPARLPEGALCPSQPYMSWCSQCEADITRRLRACRANVVIYPFAVGLLGALPLLLWRLGMRLHPLPCNATRGLQRTGVDYTFYAFESTYVNARGLRIVLRSTNHETAMLASSSEWEVRGDATADGRLAMFNATAVPSARSIRWPDGSEWTLVGPSAPMRWREASGWGLRPRSNG